MAEEFLNDAEVSTAFEEVCCEGVPQGMGVDIVWNSCGGCAEAKDLPDSLGCEFFASDGEEDFCAGAF